MKKHLLPSVFILAALLGLSPASPTLAQQSPSQETVDPADRTFTGEERVTDVSVLVEVEQKRTLDLPDGARESLEATDFVLTVDDQQRPITGLRRFSADDPDNEPWQLVIYLDAGLAGEQDLEWGARQLAEVAQELTDRGFVEIVLADPEPRVLLPASRDSELVASTLTKISMDAPGLDPLVRLRQEYLQGPEGASEDGTTAEDTTEEDTAEEELALPDPAGAPDEDQGFEDPADPEEAALEDRAARVAGELEQRLVQAQQDRLLLRLLDTFGARRALLVVSGGYDLDPEAFYSPHDMPQQEPLDLEGPETEMPLAELAHTSAQALAGYGWVVLDLLRPYVPPEEYFPRGKRVGKWRLKVFQWTYEEERDPAKAEAYFDLGKAKQASGDLQEAAEAYRKAIHHYYKDPRTAEQQAAAFSGLADVLKRLGEDDEARWAEQQAADLDPDGQGGGAVAEARLVHPAGPLEIRAQATAGAVVQSPQDLAGALRSLDQRVAVSFQLQGPPLGRLLPLEVSLERPLLASRAPAWVRSSTPSAVSAARARRLAEGDLVQGSEEVAITFRPGERPGSGHVEVDPSSLLGAPAGRSLTRTLVRISLAVTGPLEAPRVRHELLELPLSDEERGQPWSLPVDFSAGADRIAVVVEDLGTGRWGARRLEVSGL
jgi:tetratricopeptide (TPR) repeat protein